MLETRWEADYAGHKLAMTRTEITKGFALAWDGVDIAQQRWSWFGLGELRGSAQVEGKAVQVLAALRWGGITELRGKCTITVDGNPLAVRHVH